MCAECYGIYTGCPTCDDGLTECPECGQRVEDLCELDGEEMCADCFEYLVDFNY